MRVWLPVAASTAASARATRPTAVARSAARGTGSSGSTWISTAPASMPASITACCRAWAFLSETPVIMTGPLAWIGRSSAVAVARSMMPSEPVRHSAGPTSRAAAGRAAVRPSTLSPWRTARRRRVSGPMGASAACDQTRTPPSRRTVVRPDTVKDHLRRIGTKLGVETRLHAARIAWHAEGGPAHRPVRYAPEPIWLCCWERLVTRLARGGPPMPVRASPFLTCPRAAGRTRTTPPCRRPGSGGSPSSTRSWRRWRCHGPIRRPVRRGGAWGGGRRRR